MILGCRGGTDKRYLFPQSLKFKSVFLYIFDKKIEGAKIAICQNNLVKNFIASLTFISGLARSVLFCIK